MPARFLRDGRHISSAYPAYIWFFPSEGRLSRAVGERRTMKSPIRNTLLLGVLLGMAIGLGGYTFIYSKGYSYLTNNPAACANCHVMQAQYDAWLKSSHHSAATCNDCHTPHNIFGKYAVKANILALVLLHDGLVSRHHRDHQVRSPRHGKRLPPLSPEHHCRNRRRRISQKPHRRPETECRARVAPTEG